MTVTDQLKIIDNKIKANQAQYDLDRLTAKISALSSGELRKYEYLTGEDLGYRPSVLEQTKFDYSPLGKVFNKGLDDKDDQKEGLLKRLKNIEDKNEKLPNTLSEAIKAGKNVSNESDFYYNSTYNFRKHYRDFGKFKKMASVDSKLSELIKFFKLFRDFKDFKPPSDDAKKLKNKVMNKTHQLYNKYLNAYKEEYDSKDLKDEDKIFFDPSQYKILGKKKQKLEQNEEKIEREPQKPL